MESECRPKAPAHQSGAAFGAAASPRGNPAPGYLLTLGWDYRLPGGVSHVVGALAAELANLGWSPTVHWNAWRADKPHIEAGLPTPFLIWRVRPLWDDQRPVKNFAALIVDLGRRFWSWRRLQRRFRWRIVNCHFPDTSCWFWLTLKRTRLWKGAVVISVHGGELLALTESRSAIEKALMRRMFTRADAIVSCSSALAEAVVDLAPSAKARSHVIPNGVDFEALTEKVDPCFRLPDSVRGRRYILTVATFEPKKSLESLIVAFSQVAKRHEDVHLVIIGRRTPWFERVRAQAQSSCSRSRIHLLPNVPHGAVVNWLARATVFCLPSRYEGHPLALLEAATFGRPVVASDIKGVRDILCQPGLGLLTPPEDVDALAAALAQLLDKPLEATALGRRLQSFVRSRYSWRKTAQQYADLARSVTA